jgi:mono/diheme cytochrome c family protein
MRLFRPVWIMALGFTLVLAGLISAWQLALAQEPDPAQLALGARLYNENCLVCHGVNGQGRIGATLAKDWPSVQPELTIVSTIVNGVGGSVMPAWGQANGGPLTNEEINALVAYILSWQTGGILQLTPPPTPTAFPPITPIPGVEGDPNAGAALFAQNCAACHGDKGQGRIGATLAKDWSGIRPDLAVKGTISNGVSGSVMPAWSQAKGGPLSELDINNLVAFIMTLPAQPDQSQPTPAPTSTTSTFFTGWGGVLVFVVLLIAVIAIALVAQRRQS